MEKWRMGVFEQPAETWVGKRERGKERKKARENIVSLGLVRSWGAAFCGSLGCGCFGDVPAENGEVCAGDGWLIYGVARVTCPVWGAVSVVDGCIEADHPDAVSLRSCSIWAVFRGLWRLHWALWSRWVGFRQMRERDTRQPD
jgi:hypothetical protein